MIKGFRDISRENRTDVQPSSVNPLTRYRDALDVHSQIAYAPILLTQTAGAASTDSIVVNASAASYRRGDLLEFSSGSLARDYAFVESISGTSIKLSQKMAISTAGLTYNLLRPMVLRQENTSSGLVVWVEPSYLETETPAEGFAVGGLNRDTGRFNFVTIETGSSAITASKSFLDTKSVVHAFNGASFSPINGDTTFGLDVDVTRISGSVTVIPGTPPSLTASSPTFVTVGVASALAIAANANRKGLVLTNTSSNTISFGIGAAAVLNSGITLTPRGLWLMDERTFSTAQINAIASAASSNLAIQEFT